MPAPVVVAAAGAGKAVKAAKFLRIARHLHRLRQERRRDRQQRTSRRVVGFLVLGFLFLFGSVAGGGLVAAPIGLVVATPVLAVPVVGGGATLGGLLEGGGDWGTGSGLTPGGEANGDNPNSEALVKAAQSQLGVPYVWGGTRPGVGLDCSGFTQYVYSRVGIRIPRTAGPQYQNGLKVVNPQPGDLIYWGSGDPNDEHVAVYIGGGKMVHAPRPGKTVCVAPVYQKMHGTDPQYFRYVPVGYQPPTSSSSASDSLGNPGVADSK